MKYLTGFAVITLLFSPICIAQSLNEQLHKCAKTENSLRRLICYDKLAKNTEVKSKKPRHEQHAGSTEEATVEAKKMEKPASVKMPKPDKSQKAVDDNSQFGQEHKRSTDELPQQIHAIVAKVKKSAYGELIITLDNGQLWRQTDNIRLKISNGDKVYVKRGALGSFYIGKENLNKRIRAKRVK